MLNLDTHILLFALEGALSAHERKVLEGERWGISSIVFWEIAMLHKKGCVSIGLESPLLARALARLQIWPVSREVCLNMLALDFRSDPADELIAATSVTYQVPLVTRDEKILGSRLVTFA